MATTTHATLADAIRACGANELHQCAAFGPSIDGPEGLFSFELVGADSDSMSVEDAQALCEAFGGDPRANDDDGMHWDYAPTCAEVAASIGKFL
jgi:hypothetical protein